MSAPREHLAHAVAHAAHLLPAQGPIAVFVHHNTLHAFQHLPFEEALARAHEILGAEAWLPLARYRQEYAAGRILDGDLDAVLDAAPEVAPGVPRNALRTLMIHPIPDDAAAVIRWRLAESDALRRIRPDAPYAARARLRDGDDEARAVARLWDACAVESDATPGPLAALLPRVGRDRTPADLLRALTGDDAATLVDPPLVRVCAAWLDLGQSRWEMPGRTRGLYRAWRTMLLADPLPGAPWEARLCADLRAEEASDLDASDVALARLDELGVVPEHHEAYVTRVLLQLPGWAGMFHRLAEHPEERARPDLPVSLIDYLALRLTLERAAVLHLAEVSCSYDGPLRGLSAAVRAHPPVVAPADRALVARWRLFHLAQLVGRGAGAMAALDGAGRRAMLAWLDACDDATLRRLWHLAYERHHRDQVLTGLAANLRRPARERTVARPRFQLAFCIDDREEGIRRHFEEQSPRHETFGVAGFFGLAISFQPAEELTRASLCPVVVTPAHDVHEEPVAEADGARRARRRSLAASLTEATREGGASMVVGALLTPALGIASLPAVLLRLFAPRAASRFDRWIGGAMSPRPATRLRALTEASGDGEARRFSLDEAADRVRATLENIGLTRGFAPLVVLLGHGSESVNNPHRSAYDCGACGGRDGGPNARLFAAMANHPGVRERLRARGVDVPEATWFVGGLHNTATDDVTLYDLDAAPAALAGELAALREALDLARMGSAHERCRRFASAPTSLSPEEALHHVEARAADLSQARPELGHVTNAVCVVGRRSLTRGLFLDRRAFLVSYDPTDDDAGAVLERILVAVGPVGAGINLEYYFSTVDNDRLGSGTKLPHNLVGLLGVMDGAHGDLRTGLPRQMIEIHEPVRLLLVVEAPVARAVGVVERRPEVAELVLNGWIRVVCVDPADGAMYAWESGAFKRLSLPTRALPVVTHSQHWYAGRDGFLPPCLVTAGADRPLPRRDAASTESVHVA